MTRRLLASLALLASCAPKSAVELPIPDPRRDASGVPLSQPVAAVGSRYHP